jgi:hypothetical protein
VPLGLALAVEALAVQHRGHVAVLAAHGSVLLRE